MKNTLTRRERIVKCSQCDCGASYDFNEKPLCTLHAMECSDWLAFLIREVRNPTPSYTEEEFQRYLAEKE